MRPSFELTDFMEIGGKLWPMVVTRFLSGIVLTPNDPVLNLNQIGKVFLNFDLVTYFLTPHEPV